MSISYFTFSLKLSHQKLGWMKIMFKLIKVFIIAIITIATMSCSSNGDFCLLGSNKIENPDYSRTRWVSVNNKKVRATKSDIERCNQSAEDTKAALINIIAQLCHNGRISDDYLPDAVFIQKGYLEKKFISYFNKELTGTTDQVYVQLFTGIYSPSVDNLNKSCANCFSADGSFNNCELQLISLPHYTNYYFEQCMSRHDFTQFTPKKTVTYCKAPMW